MFALAIWAWFDDELHADWLWILIAAAFTVSAIYASVSMRVSSMWLRPDRIEKHGVFRRSQVALADIAGWRATDNGEIQLERRDGKRSFPLPKALVRDPRWQPWLESLTSLDDVDANAQFRAVEADTAFGNSPAQRVRTANKVRRLARLTVWPWLAILFWGFAFPRPYAWAMLANAVLPVIALAVTWRWSDLLTLDEVEAKRGGKGDLSHLFLWSGVILALRVAFDLHMLDWSGPVVVGALGAAVAGLAAVRLHHYSRLAMVWVFVSLFGWAGGSALIANQQLDFARPEIVRATVLEVDASDDDTTITVRTTGPASRTISDLDVYDTPADKLAPGSIACVAIYQGRFGWRYVYETPCPGG